MSIPVKKRSLLLLFGSPHGQGFTRRLAEAYLQPFRACGDWEVTQVDAYALNASPCLGCGACQKTEACALPDLDEWDRQLRQCDLLVVASPVYNCSFPAPVKAVLDRTQRYFEARFALGKRPPIEKHREAALLLTMGSEDSFAVEVCTRQLEQAFSVMNTALTGWAVWPGTDQGDQRWPAVRDHARRLGKQAARMSPAGSARPPRLALRRVGNDSPELPRFIALYQEAFPQNERSGLGPLLEDTTGCGEALSLWEGEAFVGLACTLVTQELAHLIYFAVEPALRDRGLGSAALEALQARYAPRPLVVDIEEPWEGAENFAQRQRRKAFYLRGGFYETPVRYRWRGEPYQLLSTGKLTQRDWEAFWQRLRKADPALSRY